MAVRIKSRWNRKDKTHTVEEVAGAVAFIIFRLAGNAVLSMENADFETSTNQQRLNIIKEFLCFGIHMADRMTIERFDENERVRFMTELAKKSAKHLQDNMHDIGFPGDHQTGFIELLNERMSDYADFNYSEEDGPSFPMRRFFGEHVSREFGDKNRRWVADQVIDIEVPEILSHLQKAVPNLFM